MDKKELKQTTTKVYEEYGFVKKGKYYYLDLEDVLICSGFASLYGTTYLAYNFSVKAVHSEEERKINDMFEGYDSMELKVYFDQEAKGYHSYEICFEEWDREWYIERLRELLHYYFDPYKTDSLNHIRRLCKEVGYVDRNDIIPVSIKAKAYLGI